MKWNGWYWSTVTKFVDMIFIMVLALHARLSVCLSVCPADDLPCTSAPLSILCLSTCLSVIMYGCHSVCLSLCHYLPACHLCLSAICVNHYFCLSVIIYVCHSICDPMSLSVCICFPFYFCLCHYMPVCLSFCVCLSVILYMSCHFMSCLSVFHECSSVPVNLSLTLNARTRCIRVPSRARVIALAWRDLIKWNCLGSAPERACLHWPAEACRGLVARRLEELVRGFSGSMSIVGAQLRVTCGHC